MYVILEGQNFHIIKGSCKESDLSQLYHLIIESYFEPTHQTWNLKKPFRLCYWDYLPGLHIYMVGNSPVVSRYKAQCIEQMTAGVSHNSDWTFYKSISIDSYILYLSKYQHPKHIFHVKKRSVVRKFIDQNHTLIS